MLNDANISPSQFELEVTESLLISDPDFMMILLTQLTEEGFKISIDDFGTGYSSLSYLKKIKASILKVDQSFIRNLDTDSLDQMIVRSIIDRGHNLGLEVVAEGVETEQQLDILSSMQCDIAQGYYFSKPLSSEEIAKYMAVSH
jgi:EAL domain-containing protein (putative c-di-GMP-specific phosphodiesterase class I)